MKKVMNLVKYSWHVRKQINNLLRYDEASTEHRIACYYSNKLDTLDETSEHDIASIRKNIAQDITAHTESAELTNLLQSVEQFFAALEVMKSK